MVGGLLGGNCCSGNTLPGREGGGVVDSNFAGAVVSFSSS